MKILLPMLICTFGLWAQNPNTACFPNTACTDANLFVNNNSTAQKTLNGAILSGASSVVLNDATGWAAPMILTACTAAGCPPSSTRAYAYCSTLTTNTLSGCVWNKEGTSAVGFASGSFAYNYLTAGYFNQFAAEIKAIEAALAARHLDYIAGGGTAQAQTAAPLPPVSTLTSANGLHVCWLPVAANTAAAPTLAVSGLTAKPITKLGTTALVANDITTTAIACVIYDGTEFQLQNPQTNTGGGGGGSFFTGCTGTAPSFSATPTISLADISVKSPCTVQPGALTANVTAVTFSNKSAGARFAIAWLQDATGGRTVTYGASVGGIAPCQIDPAASQTTIQEFFIGSDGTTVNGAGCHTTSSNFQIGEQAAPATPILAYGTWWFDSSNHIFTTMDNNSGTQSVTVVPQACAAPLTATAVSAAGVIACGYIPLTQNSKSAAYTTVLSDAGKHIYHPGADTTARIWTIDSNANVAYVIGTCITFVNDTSAGVITISITSDTMILAGAGTTGSRTLAANGIATACKMTSTRWIISGNGLT